MPKQIAADRQTPAGSLSVNKERLVDKTAGSIPDFVQADDILLASYPRSGNTWMRYLLANLIYPDRKWHVGNIGRVVPDLGEPFPEDYLAPSPRIFKTHFPRPVTRCRAIYIYRDGRDVALSFYNRRRKLRNETRTFDAFLEEMLKGGLKFDSWQAHVDAWTGESTDGRVLLVGYEAMLGDLVPQMCRVMNFLGLSRSDKEIAAAARRSDFKWFRKHVRKYLYKSHWRKGFPGGLGRGSGSWRQKMTPEEKAFFWHHAGETSARLGYPRD